MKKQHALPTAITILTVLTVAIAIIAGCTKHTNPVSALDQQMPRIANIVTPGEPEFACVHDDTIYVADNEAGVARIAMNSNFQLLSSYKPGETARGIIWVEYDSVRHAVFAADRPSTTNRLLGKLLQSVNDTMRSLQFTNAQPNSGSCFLFHDADTLLRFAWLSGGFDVYSYNWVLDTTSGLVFPELDYPTPPYNPPSLSLVNHVVMDGHYGYAVADEYGFVTISMPSWQTAPVQVGHLDLPGQAIWVAKHDSICYVATKWSGLAVVSASDPANPRLIRIVDVPTSDNQYQVEVSKDGHRLFVLDNYKGVYVFSTDDPTNPQYMGLLSMLKPVGMCVYNHYLVVCSEAEGVDIYQW